MKPIIKSNRINWKHFKSIKDRQNVMKTMNFRWIQMFQCHDRFGRPDDVWNDRELVNTPVVPLFATPKLSEKVLRKGGNCPDLV